MELDPLGSPMERDDGQMPPSLVEPDARNNWTLQRSLSPCLSAVDLVRRAAAEPGVRAMQGIPFEEDCEFCLESVPLKRNDDPAGALVLHGQDQSLDQADAPMFPDGTIS